MRLVDVLLDSCTSGLTGHEGQVSITLSVVCIDPGTDPRSCCFRMIASSDRELSTSGCRHVQRCSSPPGSLAAARKSGISSGVRQEWALALMLAVARVTEVTSVDVDPANRNFAVWADRTGLFRRETVEVVSSNRDETGRITVNFARNTVVQTCGSRA